jgi:hypothetical protein
MRHPPLLRDERTGLMAHELERILLRDAGSSPLKV